MPSAPDERREAVERLAIRQYNRAALRDPMARRAAEALGCADLNDRTGWDNLTENSRQSLLSDAREDLAALPGASVVEELREALNECAEALKAHRWRRQSGNEHTETRLRTAELVATSVLASSPPRVSTRPGGSDGS